MRRIQIAEVLDFLTAQGMDYAFAGDTGAFIRQMANINCVQDESICWIKNKDYLTGEVRQSLKRHNSVLVVAPFEIDHANVIVVEQPKHVFFPIINHFFYTPKPHTISERAVVLTERIGENVHIAPGCYICEDVEIGDNTILHPNVVIDCPCRIGRDCEIFAGTVIGADGFGYYMDHENIPHRELHFAGVWIGDNVDIGANTCIDRGLLSDTRIGNHVKIDNLVHIGHNVVIEDNCLLIAGTVIGGSTTIQKNAYLAPGTLILNQKTVGENAVVNMGSVVIRNVKDNTEVFGVPAREMIKPKIG